MSPSHHDFFATVLNPGPTPVKCASPRSENKEPGPIGGLESYGAIFKSKITRDLIRADLDNESLQDALAILLFPIAEQNAAVPCLMDQWAARKIRDPFLDMREENYDLFAHIRKFYFFALRYIQDYMMKATSYYLPRAYCGLPRLSDYGTFFKNEYLQSDFDMGSFGVVGRRRLFWAFLRYDLMGKIRLYKATLLSWEDEALRCVQEYVSGLYAAHYAQWNGIRLPNDRTADDPSHLSFPPGLRPDYHSFSRLEWTKFQAKKWSVPELLIYKLEEYGFTLLTDLILDAKKAKEHRQGKPDDVHGMCATTLWEDTENGRNVPDLCARMIWQHDCITVEALEGYRQRAWVFFDDARVHPQHRSLVNLPEIHISAHQSDSERDSDVDEFVSKPRSLYDDADSWFNM
ncbi:hypothetical protein FAUST_790 [Fusarium austroamericanum]|uniref:Uncharacterized protein n=1 Tax=Fusarium austroamericanum TaxID=282268 RepID=A0AAN6HKD3_FUSAU|nr:hypothetical protein FAUST_790 [Fusarium austroamericanum]